MTKISEYIQHNMVPQITDRNANHIENNEQSSLDFRQLLMERIQMAMEMNHQLTQTQGTDASFSQPFSIFSTGMNQEFNTSTGTNITQALSEYQKTQSEDRTPIESNAGTQQTTLHKQPPTDQYNHLIEQAAKKYNVDVNLVHAIIKMESNYNPNVESHAGASGLMQLMPATAKAVGVTDRYDIKQNIEGGVRYFSDMLHNQNGNVKLALASYNAGPGNVKKYGGIPPFQETQNYVRKVMDYYQTV